MVARLVRDQKVAGSNPVTSTRKSRKSKGFRFFFYSICTKRRLWRFFHATNVQPCGKGQRQQESYTINYYLSAMLFCILPTELFPLYDSLCVIAFIISVKTSLPTAGSYPAPVSGIACPLWFAPSPVHFSLPASGGIHPPYPRWISSSFRI